jgi:hypothetical protein
MMHYLGGELEWRRRRDLDKVATEGTRRRRWELEAREARRGEKMGAAEGPILWVRPNWTPDWKTARRTA